MQLLKRAIATLRPKPGFIHTQKQTPLVLVLLNINRLCMYCFTSRFSRVATDIKEKS